VELDWTDILFPHWKALGRFVKWAVGAERETVPYDGQLGVEGRFAVLFLWKTAAERPGGDYMRGRLKALGCEAFTAASDDEWLAYELEPQEKALPAKAIYDLGWKEGAAVRVLDGPFLEEWFQHEWQKDVAEGAEDLAEDIGDAAKNAGKGLQALADYWWVPLVLMVLALIGYLVFAIWTHAPRKVRR